MTSVNVTSDSAVQSTKKYTIAALIFLVGLGTQLFNLRHQLMSEEAVPAGDSIWEISITSQFTLTGKN